MEQVEKGAGERGVREANKRRQSVGLFFFFVRLFSLPIQRSQVPLSSSHGTSRSPPKARHCPIEPSACTRAKGVEFGGISSDSSERVIGAFVACRRIGRKERLLSLSLFSFPSLEPTRFSTPRTRAGTSKQLLLRSVFPRGNLGSLYFVPLAPLPSTRCCSFADRGKRGKSEDAACFQTNSHETPLSLSLSSSLPTTP